MTVSGNGPNFDSMVVTLPAGTHSWNICKYLESISAPKYRTMFSWCNVFNNCISDSASFILDGSILTLFTAISVPVIVFIPTWTTPNAPTPILAPNFHWPRRMLPSRRIVFVLGTSVFEGASFSLPSFCWYVMTSVAVMVLLLSLFVSLRGRGDCTTTLDR